MLLIEHDHMIEGLSPYAADDSLHPENRRAPYGQQREENTVGLE